MEGVWCTAGHSPEQAGLMGGALQEQGTKMLAESDEVLAEEKAR